MLRSLPSFEYLAPKTVEEACVLLGQHKGKAKVLAGGTDLLIYMKQRTQTPQYLIGLRNIANLEFIEYDPAQGLRIGALASHQSLAQSPLVRERFTALAQACGRIGTPQIRGRGTLGGNLCNASPSADTAPPLLALEARLKLVRQGGERLVPIEEFFTGPFTSVLAEDELLTEVQIPNPPPRSGSSYHYLPKISAVDETLVGAAVLAAMEPGDSVCREVRIGLCSVAATPIRARRAEEVLRGKRVETGLIEEAARVSAEETCPRSRADYRCQMTIVMVKRALGEALAKIE